MMNAFIRIVAVGVLVSALPSLASAADRSIIAQGKPVSAAEAAPFVGDWTLELQGGNGPATFALSVRSEKESVTAEISSDALGTQPITSISLVDKSLVLGFSFNYEGNAVSAVVSLTPDKDGKTAAQIDFAGGAYTMNGVAARKDKAK